MEVGYNKTNNKTCTLCQIKTLRLPQQVQTFEKLRRQVIESNKVKPKRGVQLMDELNTRQEGLLSIGCSG